MQDCPFPVKFHDQEPPMILNLQDLSKHLTENSNEYLQAVSCQFELCHFLPSYSPNDFVFRQWNEIQSRNRPKFESNFGIMDPGNSDSYPKECQGTLANMYICHRVWCSVFH